MNYMDVVRLRLQWAKEHLDDLDREVDLFLAQVDTCSVIRELDPKDGSYSFRVQIRQPPPPRLARYVVDSVNHLRSSLDNLMWLLAVKYKGTRVSDRTRFPICVSEDGWLA